MAEIQKLDGSLALLFKQHAFQASKHSEATFK